MVERKHREIYENNLQNLKKVVDNCAVQWYYIKAVRKSGQKTHKSFKSLKKLEKSS